MKMAIIALVAILMLGAGAAGAYFYFDKPAEAAAGPMDELAKAEHEAKVEEAAEGAVALEQFVQLDPLTLPVIGERGITQTISIVISLEVADEAAAAEVKRLSPRLQDAYIQDMYGALNRKTAMENGVLQVGPIKERLNKISARVLGENVVNDVLLQIVSQRRV